MNKALLLFVQANLASIMAFVGFLLFQSSIFLASIIFILLHLWNAEKFTLAIAKLFPQRHNYRIIGRTLILVLPGLTLFTTLMFVALYYRQSCKHILQRFEEYTSYQSTSQLNHISSKQIAEEMQIEPLIDIITSNEQELCRDAIAKLGKLHTCNTVQILKSTLNHEIPQIRLYAYYQLESLEKKLANGLREALHYTNHYPQSIKAWQQLAEKYYTYCKLKMLDQQTHQQYLKLAEQALYKAIALAPQQKNLHIEVAEILLAQQNKEQALKHLQQGISSSSPTPKTLMLQAKCYFALGEFTKVRKTVAKLNRLFPNVEDSEDIFQWWLGSNKDVG